MTAASYGGFRRQYRHYIYIITTLPHLTDPQRLVAISLQLYIAPPNSVPGVLRRNQTGSLVTRPARPGHVAKQI